MTEAEATVAFDEGSERSITLKVDVEHVLREAGITADIRDLIFEIVAELARARAKFPGENVTMAALVDEVIDLTKATFEQSRAAVRKEATQVAVMAMRVVLDGDQSLDSWRAARGLDPLVGGASE